MNPFYDLSIRKKLVFIQILTACIVLALASVAFVIEDIDKSQDEMIHRLSSTALIVGQNCVFPLLFMDGEAATESLNSLAVESHIVHACIYDESRDLFATYSRQGESIFTFPPPDSTSQGSHTFGEDHLDLFEPIIHNELIIGKIYLRADMVLLREKIEQYVTEALIVLAVGVVVSLLLSIFFQKRISNSILNLAAATRRVSETNDYSGRVKKESDDELGELCDGFNEMLEQIQHRDAELREARDSLEKRVQERTREIEDLSAMNLEQERTLRQRMEQELEEARQLQLSMLPVDKPSLPHLDISWYMETATEVGGDYYDYNFAEEGILTITLGDATGHGMRAGTVVTATKSLFQNLATQPVITETFRAMSRSLKGMNLPRLGMAMSMVKIQNHALTISSAGIPPALIYRAESREIEEVEIGGMPLGYSTGFEYEQREYDLNPGDTIVLMSDGLPERRNSQDEELGYPRTQELFLEAAERTPEEICQHLAQGGDEWADGRPQDDDVTFVVLKVK